MIVYVKVDISIFVEMHHEACDQSAYVCKYLHIYSIYQINVLVDNSSSDYVIKITIFLMYFIVSL